MALYSLGIGPIPNVDVSHTPTSNQPDTFWYRGSKRAEAIPKDDVKILRIDWPEKVVIASLRKYWLTWGILHEYYQWHNPAIFL